MYPRYLLDRIVEALNDTPVVYICGPRQSGKSTLTQQVVATTPGANYVTLDQLSVREAAEENPDGFLKPYQSLVAVDEVQRAPNLFLAIKYLVDQDRRPGRFLLTGSADVSLLPKLVDALVGRVEILYLHTLATAEVAGHQGDLIAALFDNRREQHLMSISAPPDLHENTMQRLTLGGFPEANIAHSSRQRTRWFDSYIKTLLEREIYELAHIEGLTRLPNLLRLLATRTASLLNFEELSRTSSLSATTLRRYFTLLETLFLVFVLPAWSNHHGKRLIKSPKLHLCDSGLAIFLTNLDTQGLLTNPSLKGRILETYVVTELRKHLSWSNVQATLYHYRTATGREVDLVIERADGMLIGIEVKSSETVRAKDFSGLKSLQEIAGDRFLAGIILHLGQQTLSWGNGLYSTPMSLLSAP